MSRPRCCKHVDELPGILYFKPLGVPFSEMEEVQLSVEELEALRLAHLETLYQQEAAERMQVSRATFGRILESAHQKVTRALVQGSALRIQGGDFHLKGEITCPRCRKSEPGESLAPEFKN